MSKYRQPALLEHNPEARIGIVVLGAEGLNLAREHHRSDQPDVGIRAERLPEIGDPESIAGSFADQRP